MRLLLTKKKINNTQQCAALFFHRCTPRGISSSTAPIFGICSARTTCPHSYPYAGRNRVVPHRHSAAHGHPVHVPQPVGQEGGHFPLVSDQRARHAADSLPRQLLGNIPHLRAKGARVRQPHGHRSRPGGDHGWRSWLAHGEERAAFRASVEATLDREGVAPPSTDPIYRLAISCKRCVDRVIVWRRTTTRGPKLFSVSEYDAFLECLRLTMGFW